MIKKNYNEKSYNVKEGTYLLKAVLGVTDSAFLLIARARDCIREDAARGKRPNCQGRYF